MSYRLLTNKQPAEQVQQGTTATVAFTQYNVTNSKQANKNTAEATDCSYFSVNKTTAPEIGNMNIGCIKTTAYESKSPSFKQQEY